MLVASFQEITLQLRPYGNPLPLDPDEPEKVLQSVQAMGLDYVVITSVDRDDLPDQGSSHFASVIRKIKGSGVLVEVLIPDFRGERSLVDRIINEKPAVLAHNVETVRRLTPSVRDGRAGYEQSLDLLRYVKEINPGQITKSSIMIGLGERDEEVIETMKDLREAGVDILTIGQYLRPSRKQMEVVEYCSSERFASFEKTGIKMGFSFVASGPLVRTSYRAAEAWAKGRFLND
jgi:lipoic acid synthetase